ncbi:hypothetical protein EDD16DRAFT_1525929 [Pisolithus croceorrhizus]|nr:hypothetical protein EDD16DRAFT_1525929 [Pisolithus croceorrhizus]
MLAVIDDKLSSSMINLELNNHATQAVLLDRGKGAAKQQKTPPPPTIWQVTFSIFCSCSLFTDRKAVFCFTVPDAITASSEKTEEQPTPLFLQSESPQAPQVSAAPSFVSVSQDDMLLRGRHYPDSPSASPVINPWVEDLENYPGLSFKDFLSFI